MRQTIAKNTFWLGISTTASKIIRSIIIIYAARIIGTEGYGVFTYAMSLAALFTVFSDIGLTGLLTRELSKETGPNKSYVATLSFVKILFLTFTTLLIIFVGPLIAKFGEAKSLMIILAFVLAFDSIRGFLYSIVRSQNRMQVEAGYEFVTEITTTITCLAALLISPTARSFATGYLIGSGIGFIILLISFRKHVQNIKGHISANFIKPILLTSLPFAVVGVFNVFLTNIDSVIIGIWNNTTTLGLYGAAQRPISILYLLPGFLSASIFPIMSILAQEKDHVRANILIKKATQLSIVLVLPIIVGGILVSAPLINAVFGYEYIGAVPTFRVLLLTLLPIFPGMIFFYILFAENQQSVFIKSSGIGAVINIALDFVLIPRYGIIGSAVATLCAQIVVNGILYAEIKKRYDFRILTGLRKACIALVCMTLVTFTLLYFSLPLLFIIPFAAIFYGSVLYLLREQLLQDIRTSFR